MRHGRMAKVGVLMAAGALALGLAAHAQCPGVPGYNLCLGDLALADNVTGTQNTALGPYSLRLNTAGYANVAVGVEALGLNGSGSYNVAVGWNALNVSNANGGTAVGYEAAITDTGAYNTAIGYLAIGGQDASGGYNVGVGANTLFGLTTGVDNTAVGYEALANQTTGNANVAVGLGAGAAYTGSESFNILLGNLGVAGESYVIRIGNPSAQSKTFVAGIHGATSASGVAVYVNSAGQLGTVTSSLRFKEDVADLGAAGDEILRLRPVSFHYKPQYDDGQRVLQYGLIAEEVAAVDPGLVEYGADGKPLTVRYHFVNALLLGEVQKQHATIDTLNQTIATLNDKLANLADRLARLEAAALR